MLDISTKNKVRINPELTGYKQQIGVAYLNDLLINQANVETNGLFNPEVFDKILRDDQVSAGMMQRISSVVGNKAIVEKGGNSKDDLSCASFIADILEHIDWDDVCSELLYAIFYGYSVAENIYSTDGKLIYLDAIKVRDREYFGFDANSNLVFNPLMSNSFIAKEPYFMKVIFGKTNSNELYGRGLAHQLYYPTLFKHAGVSYWSEFLDATASPKIIGKVDDYAQDEEKGKMLEMIKSMRGAGGGVFGKSQELDVLESQRDGREFNNFIDFFNRAISKTILGQSLTIEDGTSRSFGKTLLEIRQERAIRDSFMIDNEFNKVVVKFLCEANFPNAKPPIVTRDLEVKEDIESRSRADVRIFSTGARPTQDYITRTYGEGWILPPAIAEPEKITIDNRVVSHANGEISTKEGGKVSFAESEVQSQKDIDKVSDELIKSIDMKVGDMVIPIVNFMEKNGITKTIEKLTDLMPEKSFDDIVSEIENAQLVASALGSQDG